MRGCRGPELSASIGRWVVPDGGLTAEVQEQLRALRRTAADPQPVGGEQRPERLADRHGPVLAGRLPALDRPAQLQGQRDRRTVHGKPSGRVRDPLPRVLAIRDVAALR